MYKEAKVENFVKQINKAHDKVKFWSIEATELLRVIFDYDELNEYGKVIVRNAEFTKPHSSSYKTGNIRKLDKTHETPEKRKMIINDFVSLCRGDHAKDVPEEGFYLILWSLIVVTVDKTNKEEKLSIICDLARMLMISDIEIKDMIEIIRIIYGISESEVLSQNYASVVYGTKEYDELKKLRLEALKNNIKSERTFMYFSPILEQYLGITEDEILDYIRYEKISKSFWG